MLKFNMYSTVDSTIHLFSPSRPGSCSFNLLLRDGDTK